MKDYISKADKLSEKETKKYVFLFYDHILVHISNSNHHITSQIYGPSQKVTQSDKIIRKSHLSARCRGTGLFSHRLQANWIFFWNLFRFVLVEMVVQHPLLRTGCFAKIAKVKFRYFLGMK